jgi:hypothetical protein
MIRVAATLAVTLCPRASRNACQIAAAGIRQKRRLSLGIRQ